MRSSASVDGVRVLVLRGFSIDERRGIPRDHVDGLAANCDLHDDAEGNWLFGASGCANARVVKALRMKLEHVFAVRNLVK